MRWNFIILRFLKSAECFLLMCWICAETLQECAETLLFSRFLKSTEYFLRMWWTCADTLQELRLNCSLDVVNLCWNFASNALKFYCFHFFSKVLKLLYGCAEFVLKLCKKWAKISFFYVFSKALNFFLRMCYICAETLQMRWNFIVFTFSQKCWNFSTDLLNLRWK